MATYHQVLHHLSAHNRTTQVKLAHHFGWDDDAKRKWIEALRGWEWIYPTGRVRLTKEGKRALERMERER